MNDIIEIPTHIEPEHDAHIMADNDMDSSDLNFSEDKGILQDEHAYQIDQLGDFEVDKSLSEDLPGLNKEQSVDFSDGQLSSDLDQKMAQPANIYTDKDLLGDSEDSYSYMSQDSSNANQLDSSFETDDEGEDEWDRFVQDERSQQKPTPKPTKAPAVEPTKPAASKPVSKPVPMPESTNAPAKESDYSGEESDEEEFSSSGSSGSSSSSSSSMSSSDSSSSSFSSESLADRRNDLIPDNIDPKIPQTP